MIDLIPDDWRSALADTIADPRFAQLTGYVAIERARTDTAICPAEAMKTP